MSVKHYVAAMLMALPLLSSPALAADPVDLRGTNCPDCKVPLLRDPPQKEEKAKEKEPPVVVEKPEIITRDLLPPTQNCASADGTVYKCN